MKTTAVYSAPIPVDDQAKTSVSLSGQYFGDYSSRQNLAMDLTFKFEVLH